MLNKLKNTLSNIREQERDQESTKKKLEVQVFSPEEMKKCKELIQKFKQNIQDLEHIASTNTKDLREFIAQRLETVQQTQEDKQNQDDGQDEKFSFDDDIKQIKQILQQVQQQTDSILKFQQAIMSKLQQIQQAQVLSPSVKVSQDLLSKYESQISSLKASEANTKQICATLGQQSQLYQKQMKDLQQKMSKLSAQISQKNNIISNLKEQKEVLLEMRRGGNEGGEVEALKGKIGDFQKRLQLERTKLQQKDKQIQTLRKRMQEDRQSLQKIADELKQKQLKSKKYIDKYERSKIEIRKFRQEKTQFIKQLNLQVAKVSEQLAQEKKKNLALEQEVAKLREEVQMLKTEVSRNQNRKIQLQSCQNQLVQVRKQLHEKNMQEQQKLSQIKRLTDLNTQLQSKRKQLLQALQKPITHQIRTLQKILKALDKLYKDYITIVFQQGNIVGFQNRIMHIVSNVQEIKEDLLM